MTLPVLTQNGSDITNKILTYIRTSELCSGIANLDIEVATSIAPSFSIGDEIILNEAGTKMATFYLSGKEDQGETGKTKLTCQDYSKYMQEYLVTKEYKARQGDTTRYWIEFFLGLAKISYNFNTSSYGTLIQYDMSFGFEFVYNIVQNLCVQSGWYFYFDENKVCQIGKLKENFSNPVETFKEDTNIESIQTTQHDEPLRNRAIVWGAYDPNMGESIYAVVDRQTPWNIDSQDDRTVVYTNPLIEDTNLAYYLAGKIVDEFDEVAYEKVIDAIDHFDLFVGDTIYVESRLFTGVARIYKIVSKIEKSGRRTQLFLDIKCPRLIYYYIPGSDVYVYAGTTAHGVWRKPFETNQWEAYNQGIETKYINDLFINDGVFVTVAGDGDAYHRSVLASTWSKLSFTSFSGEIDVDEFNAQRCTMNRATNDIYVGYTLPSGTPLSSGTTQEVKSWVARYYGNAVYDTSFPVITTGIDSYEILDLEHNSRNLLAYARYRTKISGVSPPGQLILDAYRAYGDDEVQEVSSPQNCIDSRHIGYAPSDTAQLDLLFYDDSLNWVLNNPYIIDGQIALLREDELWLVALDDGFYYGYELSPALSYNTYAGVYKEDSDTWHFVTDSGIHYKFIISTLTLTNEGSLTHTAYAGGLCMFQNIAYLHNGTSGDLLKYDVLTKSETVWTASNTPDAVAAGISDQGILAINCRIVEAGGTLSLKYTLNSGSGWGSEQTLKSWSFTGTVKDEDMVVKYLVGEKATGNFYFSIGGHFYDDQGDPYPWYAYSVLMDRTGSITTTIQSLEGTLPESPEFVANPNIGSLTRTNGFSLVSNTVGVPRGFAGRVNSYVEFSSYPAQGTLTHIPSLESEDTTYTRYARNQVIDELESVFLSNDVSGGTRDIYVPYDELKYTFTSEDQLPEGEIYFLKDRLLYAGAGRAALYKYNEGVGNIEQRIKSLYPPSGMGWKVLLLDEEEHKFTVIEPGIHDCRVEISKGSPTTLYQQTGQPGDHAYKSWSLASGSFFVDIESTFSPFPLKEILDLRGYRLTKNTAITVLSGVTPDTVNQTEFMSFIGRGSDYSNLYIVQEAYDAGDQNQEGTLFVEPSGLYLHRLETTNYYAPNQWMFVSTSGSPSKFWQTWPSGVNFVEHSNNLPNSRITIIRADDRV